MSVQDWSATADDNASIDGINVAEHCPAKNLNDAIRAVMAGVKGRDGETVHLEGTETISGNKTFSSSVRSTSTSALLHRHTSFSKGDIPETNRYWQAINQFEKNGIGTSNLLGQMSTVITTTGEVRTYLRCMQNISGSTVGESLGICFPPKTVVDGKVTECGQAYAYAPSLKNGSQSKIFTEADATDMDAKCVHTTGDETISGVKTFTGNVNVKSAYIVHPGDPNGCFFIRAGDNNFDGAMIKLFGRSNAEAAGRFAFYASDKSSSTSSEGTRVSLVGEPNGSLTWGGKEVERVNSYGSDCVRFESGLQLVWMWCNDIECSTAASDPAAVQPYYGSKSFTFSKPFSGIPIVTASHRASAERHSVSTSEISATGFTVSGTSADSGGKVHAQIIAIGRWK